MRLAHQTKCVNTRKPPNVISRTVPVRIALKKYKQTHGFLLFVIIIVIVFFHMTISDMFHECDTIFTNKATVNNFARFGLFEIIMIHHIVIWLTWYKLLEGTAHCTVPLLAVADVRKTNFYSLQRTWIRGNSYSKLWCWSRLRSKLHCLKFLCFLH